MSSSWGLSRAMHWGIMKCSFQQQTIPGIVEAGKFSIVLSSDIIGYDAASITGQFGASYGIATKDLTSVDFSAPGAYPGVPEHIYIHTTVEIVYSPSTINWDRSTKSAVLAYGSALDVFWSVPFSIYKPGGDVGYKLAVNEVLTIPEGGLSFCISGGGLS